MTKDNGIDADLGGVFNEIGDSNLSESFNRYIASLDSFYNKYTSQASDSLLLHEKQFDIAYCDEDERNLIDKALSEANYDITSLKGESIVLFNQPVIVSELNCLGVSQSEDAGSVRLISFQGQDKKIISSRKRYSYSNATELSKYKIYDVVKGLILPPRSRFHSVKCANFRGLVSDHEKLISTQENLHKAEEAPIILSNQITSKVNEINKQIRVSRDKFESISGDIKALEEEKKHAVNSLDNGKASLAKVRDDLKVAQDDYVAVSTESTLIKNRLDTLQLEFKSKEKSAQDEVAKLKQVEDEAKIANDSLVSLKKELADAKRENNLTSLDMVGHQSETNHQLRMYYFFATLAFLGLACVAIYIYQNGETFASNLSLLVHVSAWDIFLSRLPLVTATTIILGGLSGIFAYLIKHIVSLNTEKMTMLKAAILAEQMSNSLGSDSMTEEEQLEFKRDTKIKLITQVFSINQPEPDKNNLVIETIKALNPK